MNLDLGPLGKLLADGEKKGGKEKWQSNRARDDSLESTNLADSGKGPWTKALLLPVIFRINLVDVELLIRIRLVICSVDKAKEMGMDWWVNNPAFCSRAQLAQKRLSG